MLTLNKIVESGKDRDKFNQQFVQGAYGEVLEERVADTIFAAYAIVAGDSPQYMSNAKASGKPVRPGKSERADRLNAEGQPSIEPDSTGPGYVVEPHHTWEGDFAFDMLVDGIWYCSLTSAEPEAAGQASSSTQIPECVTLLQ